MQSLNQNRRQFINSAAMTLAALPLANWASAATESAGTASSATPAATLGTTPETTAAHSPGTASAAPAAASPIRRPIPPLGPLKQINAGLLNVGYIDDGPANGPVVLLLHGWPYDIHSYVEVAPILTAKGYRVIIPYVRGCGTTQFLSAGTVRSGQTAAVAQDVIDLMDALKIQKAVVGGFDWGGRSANVVAALWPERCKAMVSVSGYLISSPAANKQPLPPSAELQWWYQFYFATERGALGYDKYRHDFNKLIWTLASPKWAFDDATFDRTAESFGNPDYAKIVIHNYRFRLGIVEGDAKYSDLEARIGARPIITVPSITLEGDANGAPHYPDDKPYRDRFSGKYTNRVITGGIGHNLPQEAPEAFARAIIEVDGY